MIISVSYTINLIKSLTDGASPLELNTMIDLIKEYKLLQKTNKTKRKQKETIDQYHKASYRSTITDKK